MILVEDEPEREFSMVPCLEVILSKRSYGAVMVRTLKRLCVIIGLLLASKSEGSHIA
jgi:hypothetical protein